MLFVDSNFGRPLPEFDDIWPEESGNGYALRMLERNSLAFSELAALVASIGHCYLASNAASYIAFLFGAQASAVRRAIPEQFVRHGKTQVHFMGHLFTRPYLVRHTRPQLCPICIEEKGYTKAVWDLALATACTVHAVHLVDRCSSCSRAISWRRPGLLNCVCGETFTATSGQRADHMEVWFNHCLEDKFNQYSAARQEGGLGASFLDSLGLDVMMRLVRSLGIHSVLKNGKAVPGKVTRTLTTAEMRGVVLGGISRCFRLFSGDSGNHDSVWDLRNLLDEASYGDWRRLRQLLSEGHLIESSKSWAKESQLSLGFEGGHDD